VVKRTSKRHGKPSNDKQSDESRHFEDVARKLLKVPKSEISDKGEKA
jgi:hypothetical protein